MPWQETSLMDQRVQFIADYQRDVFEVADLARRRVRRASTRSAGPADKRKWTNAAVNDRGASMLERWAAGRCTTRALWPAHGNETSDG